MVSLFNNVLKGQTLPVWHPCGGTLWSKMAAWFLISFSSRKAENIEQGAMDMHSPVFSYLCGHDLNTLIGAMREKGDNTWLFGK